MCIKIKTYQYNLIKDDIDTLFLFYFNLKDYHAIYVLM